MCKTDSKHDIDFTQMERILNQKNINQRSNQFLKITPPNFVESNSKIFTGSQQQRSSPNVDFGEMINKLSENKNF